LGSNPAPAAPPAESVSEAPVTAAVDEAAPEAAENPDQPLTDGDDSTIIAVISEGQDVLRIRFLGESWVEVNDDSAERGYRDLQHAGDVLEVTGTAPFNILLGDAPYTRLSLNGAEIDVSDEIRIDNSARLTVGL
jgi:cytoskeleton protein RodZ